MKVLILLIIISGGVYGQTNCDCFERLQFKAEYYFFTGQKKSALPTYQKALKFKVPNSYTSYDDLIYAKYLIADNRYDSAFYYLKRAYENGAYSIEHDYDFKNFVESDHYKELKEVKRISPDHFHWEFYEKIIELRGLDQAIRRNGQLKELISDKELTYQIVDSINFQALLQLIDQYGLPSFPTHGFSFGHLNFLFLHSSVYAQKDFEQIRTILHKAIELGLYKKSSLANLIDRRLDWVDKKSQMYGTWNYPGTFNEISDIKTVDSLRFQMNLLTLKDYGEMTGRVLPKGYEERSYPPDYFCEDKEKEKE